MQKSTKARYAKQPEMAKNMCPRGIQGLGGGEVVPFLDEGECISSYMRLCGCSVCLWCFGAIMWKLLGVISGSWVGVANIVKVRGCRSAVAWEREGKNGFLIIWSQTGGPLRAQGLWWASLTGDCHRPASASRNTVPIDGPFGANLGCIFWNARFSVRMPIRPELVPFVRIRYGYRARA